MTCSVVHDLRKAASPPGYSREDSLTSQEGEVHPWSSAVHRVSSRNEDPRTTSPRKARQWPPPPLPRSPPRFLTERGYGKQLHHHGRYIGREDGWSAVHRIPSRNGPTVVPGADPRVGALAQRDLPTRPYTEPRKSPTGSGMTTVTSGGPWLPSLSCSSGCSAACSRATHRPRKTMSDRTQPVLHGPFTALAHEPDTVTDENRFGDHGRAAPLMHGGKSFPERVDEKVCSSHKPFRTPGWGTGPGQGRETPGRAPGRCVSAGSDATLSTPQAAR